MTTLGNPEQKLFLRWQPSDDVDGVYENGNRLAESMPSAFHTPKREGERQRLQRLAILWKNSSPVYKKNSGLICPYSKHFVVDIAWLLWPKTVRAIKHEQSEQEDKPAAG